MHRLLQSVGGDGGATGGGFGVHCISECRPEFSPARKSFPNGTGACDIVRDVDRIQRPHLAEGVLFNYNSDYAMCLWGLSKHKASSAT